MRGRGCRLDQQGVFADVDSDSGWPLKLGVADRSADWKAVLEGGHYPYATFPLTKLTYRMPDVEAGRSCCLFTLLAATRSDDAAHGLREPEPGRVCVDATAGSLPDLQVDDRDLSVRARGLSLEVRFAEVPPLPEALQRWSARA